MGLIALAWGISGLTIHLALQYKRQECTFIPYKNVATHFPLTD